MFNKGLHLDSEPLNQPEGTYRYLKDGSLSERPGSISTNRGDTLIHTLPASTTVLGNILLSDDIFILFTVGSFGSRIVLLDVSDNTTTTILEDADISDGTLSFAKPIQGVSKVNSKGERIIYWVEDGMPPRRLNIDNIPSPLNLKNISIFSTIDSYPEFDSISLSPGSGILEVGTYSFALALIDSEGSTTPYVTVSQPFSVPEEVGEGAESGTRTSNGIEINVSNIDTDYQFVRIAVVHNSDVTILPDIPVASTFSFVYSGTESGTPGSIDEVIINPAYYTSAETITQSESRLYMGNLKSDEVIDFQKYANNIVLERITLDDADFDIARTTTVTTELNPGYGDPDLFYLKTYQRDEIYAFYISLILKNGTETPAYHIPGRVAENNETDTLALNHPMDAVRDNVGEDARFRFVSRDGTNGMGYWENKNETYPNTEDSEVWEVVGGVGQATGTDFGGQNVRHHKFPGTEFDIPYREIITDAVPNPVTKESRAIINGIRLTNVQIPDDIKEKIIGYKVYYAKRTNNNRTVLGQATTHRRVVDTILPGGEDLTHVQIDDDGSLGATQNFILARDFSLLTRRVNLGPLSYAKKIATPSASHPYDRKYRAPVDHLTELNTEGFVVDWARYIDAGVVVTLPEWEWPFSNEYGPDLIAMSLSHESGFDPFESHMNFYRFAVDLYNPLYGQQLVWTGYVHTDLDNLNSGDIYGGDTYINLYSYAMVEPNANDYTARINKVIVESIDNINLNHNDDDGEDDETVAYAADDGEYKDSFSYNSEYSNLADTKPAFPYNTFSDDINNFETRVVRSRQESIDKGDEYKIFLENEFLDLPRNKGEVVNLVDQGGILLIHTKETLYRTRGREELLTTDFRAYLGSGDIFAVKPQEVFSLEEGYGGLQDFRHAVMTPQGYFFFDEEAGRMYSLSSGLGDISSVGVRSFFRDKEFTSTRVGYDPRLGRVFLKTYDGNEDVNLSFLTAEKVWESFHTGIPDYMMHNRNNLFSSKGTQIYKVGITDPGEYLGTVADTTIQTVVNRDPYSDKQIIFLLLNIETLDDLGDPVYNAIPKSIRVRNSHQDSGVVPLVLHTQPNGNIRRTKGIWKINQLRDTLDSINGFPSWFANKRLSDKYHIIDLVMNNDNFVYLFGVDLATKKAIR